LKLLHSSQRRLHQSFEEKRALVASLRAAQNQIQRLNQQVELARHSLKRDQKTLQEHRRRISRSAREREREREKQRERKREKKRGRGDC